MKTNIPRLMIVGTGSGCGKTTVTCALLKCLIDKGENVTSFKCGPDYIDPMFHSKVIGTKSRNLDLFMCDENTVKYLFAKNCENSSIAIVEGVMGMYDGIGFDNDTYSANHISKVICAPQILIVNVKGKSLSVVAEISGYMNFKENNLKGVILNNCTSNMYKTYKKTIEEKLNIKVFGYMPNIKESQIKSRHLGLVTANEIVDIKQKIQALGDIAQDTLDIDKIIMLAKSAKVFEYSNIPIEKIVEKEVNIAVAMDNAFCFYYEDSLNLLQSLGANLIYFSPLNDEKLPENISGLILGGGYPEENIEKLSNNKSMLISIKKAIENGLPTYAECGGFMYLGSTITINNHVYNTVNAIDNNFFMTDKLVNFGYASLSANCDTMLCNKGDTILCHEFHYSNSDNNGDAFTALKQNGASWNCIINTKNIFAGYPHLHFWSNINFAKAFVKKCFEYTGKEEKS